MATRNDNHLHGQTQLHGDTKDMLCVQLIGRLDRDNAVMMTSNYSKQKAVAD